MFTIRLDYEVYTPGGLINLEKRIVVEDSKETKGSFNLTYVGAKKGIIPMILLSYIIPNWDLVSLDEVQIENEDYESIQARGRIDLMNVNQNALVVSFKEANREYEIKSYKVSVYYVFEEADTDLETGDIILSVNGKTFETVEEMKSIIKEESVGSKVNFKIERNGKKLDAYGIIYENEGEKIVGLYLTPIIDVETDPKVTFNYKRNEQGSSGGLMSALEIYNQLVSEDITGGKKISGTGTIELDGSVGEIGGVKYKLAGAVKRKSDIFIVPSGNYEEALEEKNKNNYDIILIEADNFKNVLEKLKKVVK